MADVNLVQQASEKLQPLIAMVGDNGARAAGPVPMALDSALAQPQSPTYLRSLEALFHSNSPQADQVIRSQAGNYKTSAPNSAPAQRDSGGSAKTQETIIGLGLFNPGTYMRGKKDQGSGGDGQGRQPGQQYPQIGMQQVSMIAQMMQAQGLYDQQQNGLMHLLTPIRADGVNYVPLSANDVTNSFQELMNELGYRLAGELNGRGDSSDAPPAKAGDLMSEVPGALTAEPMSSESVVKMLEEAISLRMLQENRNMAQQDQSGNVMEAARLVLTTLVNKLQSGEIESSPAVMNSIVEALEGLIALNPELKNSSVGQRLTAMKAIVASMPKPDAGSQSDEPEEMPQDTPALDTTGWKVGGSKDLGDRNPVEMPRPQAYNVIASGNIDGNGVMSGVGFGDNSHESFNYQLQPDESGYVHIINRSDPDDHSFRAMARMDRDDNGRPTSLAEGCLMWHGGLEGIRLHQDGRGEVTSDAGKNWIPLPNGEISRYTSPDQRYDVSYNPVEQNVQLLERDERGKGSGAATMAADGFAVSFSNVSTDRDAVIGGNLPQNSETNPGRLAVGAAA